ncbi:MAG: flippase-like domain-containing protein [Deltaproteobacteria bacterium]|nr:flippase-like domain-containing protein [Deltaproteobacteria bacterium]
MTTKEKWLLLLLTSLSLSLAAPLLLGGFSQFRLLYRLSIGAVLLLILLKLISWAFNALRAQFLLSLSGRELGFLNAASTTIAAEFAGVTTPGAVGMAATYAFLFNRLGLSLGRATGLVGIIVVTDLFLYGTIMPAAALIQVIQGGWSYHNLRLVALSLVVVAGGAYFFWALIRYHRRVYGFIGRYLAIIPWLVRRRWSLGRATVDFLRAVRVLRQMSWSERLALYLITLDFWLPRYLILLLVIDMMNQSVPAAYLLLTQAMLHLAGQASFIPGGAGVEEGGYAAFMSPFMGADVVAFTLLVWRTFTFYWYIVVGGPIFVYEAGRAAWDLLGKTTAETLPEVLAPKSGADEARPQP